MNRIDFPREVIKSETLFTNMIIDETTSRPEHNCDDVYVYITDTVKPGKLRLKFLPLSFDLFVVNETEKSEGSPSPNTSLV